MNQEKFIMSESCAANLFDYELEKSYLVKKEAMKSRIYMKYLLLK